MRGEIYYWIAAVVVILAVALYIRYYYTQGIDISVSFPTGTSGNTAYIYQNRLIPLTVLNNGPTVRGFDIGILINGNLSHIYNVTLASGKETVIDISHTFDASGTYNVTAVGDPAKLYNLADRAKASSSFVVNVSNPSVPAPGLLLPEGQDAAYASNMSSMGYAVASYLHQNYSVGQLGLSDMPLVNRFLYPMLNLTEGYIANISYAGADYPGAKAFSLWFSGYVSPTILDVAAQSNNMSVSNETLGGMNISMISLNSNTTLCGWYDAGWIKMMAYQGNATCARVLGNVSSGVRFSSLSGSVPHPNGSVEVANFSAYNKYWNRYGRISLFAGQAFTYTTLWKNITQNTECFGIVDYVNGTSYCSVYMLPVSGAVNSTALVKTTAYLGEYNETVFSLVNETKALEQVGVNIALLKAFGITGRTLNFTQGIKDSCSFTGAFACSNVSYGNGTVSFSLENAANSTIRINSISCAWNGQGNFTQTGKTLAGGASLQTGAVCYNYGSRLAGIALNLNLNLVLNYTINGTTKEAPGRAYIV